MTPEDIAQAKELAEYEENQKRAISPLPVTPSAKRCEDCGERIPKARREALPGVKLCVDCQEFNEKFKGR